MLGTGLSTGAHCGLGDSRGLISTESISAVKMTSFEGWHGVICKLEFAVDYHSQCISRNVLKISLICSRPSSALDGSSCMRLALPQRRILGRRRP